MVSFVCTLPPTDNTKRVCGLVLDRWLASDFENRLSYLCLSVGYRILSCSNALRRALISNSMFCHMIHEVVIELQILPYHIGSKQSMVLGGGAPGFGLNTRT